MDREMLIAVHFLLPALAELGKQEGFPLHPLNYQVTENPITEPHQFPVPRARTTLRGWQF